MAKINLFFKDLSEDNKLEIVRQLKIELKGEIDEVIEGKKYKKVIETEFIDDYINTHNLANEFKI